MFTPQEHGAERFYTFEGEGSISPIIAGIAGLQRVWWPQRDSIPFAAVPVRGVVYRRAA